MLWGPIILFPNYLIASLSSLYSFRVSLRERVAWAEITTYLHFDISIFPSCVWFVSFLKLWTLINGNIAEERPHGLHDSSLVSNGS